jgi:hypothetical protein
MLRNGSLETRAVEAVAVRVHRKQGIRDLHVAEVLKLEATLVPRGYLNKSLEIATVRVNTLRARTPGPCRSQQQPPSLPSLGVAAEAVWHAGRALLCHRHQLYRLGALILYNTDSGTARGLKPCRLRRSGLRDGRLARVRQFVATDGEVANSSAPGPGLPSV